MKTFKESLGCSGCCDCDQENSVEVTEQDDSITVTFTLPDVDPSKITVAVKGDDQESKKVLLGSIPMEHGEINFEISDYYVRVFEEGCDCECECDEEEEEDEIDEKRCACCGCKQEEDEDDEDEEEYDDEEDDLEEDDEEEEYENDDEEEECYSSSSICIGPLPFPVTRLEESIITYEAGKLTIKVPKQKQIQSKKLNINIKKN